MKLKIAGRNIGDNYPVFIVAELSCNHLNNLKLAKQTVKVAAKAGADALKTSTLTPDTMTINCDKKPFLINGGTPWDGRTLYDLYSETSMPYKWHFPLKDLAEKLGLVFFSTAYDQTAADFLKKKINPPVYKIASFELTDIPLIKHIASFGKPMIMSTGMATLRETEEAVKACREMGNNQIALLKCTSAYPTPMDKVNLRTMADLAKRFKVVVGISDHTLGITVPVAATALGAKIIEKHIILKRELGGPDAGFSLESEEFATMVKAVRDIEKALGKVTYTLTDVTKKSRKFSRSLFAVKDIKREERFTKENVRSIRPSDGLKPKYFRMILGKKAKKAIRRGTPLAWRFIS
jgi:pseudaminic acid synthase